MLYLMLASLVWAFSWGLIKGQLTSLDPNFVATARIALAVPVFLPFFRAQGMVWRERLYLMFLGAIQYGCMYLLVIRAYQYLQAYQVVLFTTCTPIYVTLIHDLYTRTFRPFYLLTAGIALVGAASIYYKSGQDLSGVLTGFLLVQAADVCFAFGQVAYKQFRSKRPELRDGQIYMLLFLGATLVTAAVTTCLGGWQSLQLATPTQWYTLSYLGVIATGISFFWWNKGATQVHAGTLAIVNNLKIPLGVLVSLFVFGESADLKRVGIALGLVIFAMVLAEYRRKIIR